MALEKLPDAGELSDPVFCGEGECGTGWEGTSSTAKTPVRIDV